MGKSKSQSTKGSSGVATQGGITKTVIFNNPRNFQIWGPINTQNDQSGSPIDCGQESDLQIPGRRSSVAEPTRQSTHFSVIFNNPQNFKISGTINTQNDRSGSPIICGQESELELPGSADHRPSAQNSNGVRQSSGGCTRRTKGRAQNRNAQGTSKNRAALKRLDSTRRGIEVGKISKNPFFNYVRHFRTLQCGGMQKDIVCRAAIEWREMTSRQKSKFKLRK